MKQPLAVRMRPKTIDNIVGQEHITYENSILWKMINNDVLSSLILYGPPGTGKTSIANVIANSVKADFQKINAVAAGKKDIEQVIKIAFDNLKEDKRTILFIDEIHRFNKAQQDYLLPFVEDGTVIFIGATTENPFFEVNSALLSRSTIFKLNPINKESIIKVIDKTLKDERGLLNECKSITDQAKNLIAEQANGDVRFALTLLEKACVIADGNINEEHIKSIIQRPNLRYDKDGDSHHNTTTAFIESMRGSDPDATLYYLARMIESGEDIKFIARRIIISASEDVGNADPMALVLATNTSLAVERIGIPEGYTILSQAALYVAMAPKCMTAYNSLQKARKFVRDNPSIEIPLSLRNAHYKGASEFGYGNLLNVYDYPNNWVEQRYLPDNVNEHFYQNSHIGYEKAQANYQNNIRASYRNNKESE